MRRCLLVGLVVLVFGCFAEPVQAKLVFDEQVYIEIPIINEPRVSGVQGTTMIMVDGPRTMWAPRIYWHRPSRYHILYSPGSTRWGESSFWP